MAVSLSFCKEDHGSVLWFVDLPGVFLFCEGEVVEGWVSNNGEDQERGGCGGCFTFLMSWRRGGIGEELERRGIKSRKSGMELRQQML